MKSFVMTITWSSSLPLCQVIDCITTFLATSNANVVLAFGYIIIICSYFISRIKTHQTMIAFFCLVCIIVYVVALVCVVLQL